MPAKGVVKDLTGRQFGEWTVLSEHKPDKHRRTHWLCRCSCGTTEWVDAGSLIKGTSTKCFNCGIGSRAEKRRENLEGLQFGEWTVTDRHRSIKGKTQWFCVCSCGKRKWVNADALKRGCKKCKSCSNGEHNRIHNGCRTRLYGVWSGMKTRCYNENVKAYKYYGGRGIVVCDEWLNDFSAFQEWAIANGYDENAKQGNCTIDRINTDGNYEPSNCRWVSMTIQNQNKRGIT